MAEYEFYESGLFGCLVHCCSLNIQIITQPRTDIWAMFMSGVGRLERKIGDGDKEGEKYEKREGEGVNKTNEKNLLCG